MDQMGREFAGRQNQDTVYRAPAKSPWRPNWAAPRQDVGVLHAMAVPKAAILGLAVLLATAFVDAYRYRTMAYWEINDSLLRLARQHPSVLSVYSAHQRFGLVAPGLCRSTARGKPTQRCQTLVAEVGVQPVNAARPQLLLLGSLHGDERLGALVAFNLVRLLVERRNSDPWINRLVATRSLTIIPLPNPSGYDRSMRYEEAADGELIDPMTDFPPGARCLRSVAARLVDRLFRSNLFRIAVIFDDAGKNFIGYPWGDYAHCHPYVVAEPEDGDQDFEEHLPHEECAEAMRAQWQSPDDVAYRRLAAHMSSFAGELRDPNGSSAAGSGVEAGLYRTGPLNDPESDSGPIRGSIVDWSYSASWAESNPSDTACAPAYSNTSHRSLAFLVRPATVPMLSDTTHSSLGSSTGLYVRETSQGNGHIPRNLRLSLLAADALQPYVFFLDVAGQRNDLVKNGMARLKWSIGGAFAVDSTFLEFECVEDPTVRFSTLPQSGGSMWAQNTGYDTGIVSASDIFARLAGGGSLKWAYSESVSVLRYLPKHLQNQGTTLRVRAVASVDSEWRATNSTPTSHLCRARIDPAYQASSGQFRIQGARVHSSDPLVLYVPPNSLFGWYTYAGDFVVLAVFFFVVPPALVAWRIRRSAAASGPSSLAPSALRQQVDNRVRRAVRAFSRRDIREEIARLRSSTPTPTHPTTPNRTPRAEP